MRRLCRAALLLVLAVCGTPASAESRPSAWTIMLYVSAAHANAAVELLKIIEQCGEVGTTPQIEVLALIDQDAAGAVCGTPPWRGAVLARVHRRRLEVLDTRLDGPASFTNMGDPATLASLIRVGVARGAGRRLVLVTMGHGNGCEGICIDQTGRLGEEDQPAPTTLSYSDLCRGIALGLGRSRRAIDLLVLGNCTAGCLEAAVPLHGYCHRLIAAEGLISEDALDGASLLQRLNRRPSIATDDLARLIVSEAIFPPLKAEQCLTPHEQDQSLALIDVQAVPNLRHELRRLVETIQDDLRGSGHVGSAARAAIERACRVHCTECVPKLQSCTGYAGAGACCMRDLGLITRELRRTGTPTVDRAAARVEDALDRCVLSVRSRPRPWCESGEHMGLSIFVTCRHDDLDTYESFGHLTGTGWAQLLRSLYPEGCPPPIDDPGPSPCLGPVSVVVSASDRLELTTPLGPCPHPLLAAWFVVETQGSTEPSRLLSEPIWRGDQEAQPQNLNAVWRWTAYYPSDALAGVPVAVEGVRSSEERAGEWRARVRAGLSATWGKRGSRARWSDVVLDASIDPTGGMVDLQRFATLPGRRGGGVATGRLRPGLYVGAPEAIFDWMDTELDGGAPPEPRAQVSTAGFSIQPHRLPPGLPVRVGIRIQTSRGYEERFAAGGERVPAR
jgi:hypothetical protein